MAMENLTVNIAGIGLELRGLPEGPAVLMKKRYGAFLGGDARGVFDITWGEEILSDGPWDMEFFRKDEIWTFGRGDFTAQWNTGEKLGRATFDDSEYSFDAFLRAFISMTLLHEGGGLMHSCGLVKDGAGYLFAGVSGAGKSTLAGRAGKEYLLSDELTALRRRPGGFEVCGTPFMGELNIGGRNVCAPIDRVYLLDRRLPAGRHEARASEAAADLWSTLMCFSRSSCYLELALDLCQALATTLPVERISVNLEKDIWEQVV